MKVKLLILLTLISILHIRCSGTHRTDLLGEEFNHYCDSCGVDGTIAIYDLKNERWLVSDPAGIQVESLPASTFKIIHILIALETNTIRDEYEVVKWPGSTDTVKYGYRPDIYRDMSVKEAFELSAGWVFIELSKKIGKEKYREYLKSSKYGNDQLTQKDPDFWNFGDFGISPQNQVEFLKAFYQEKLPFSKRNIDIAKKVMLAEETTEYTIRAKTGWTRDNNVNTGWWTGYIETRTGTYFFSTRLIQDRAFNRSDFGNCRKEITRKVFRDLGVL